MARAHTLTDDFADGVIDTAKWSTFGAALLAERSGTLQVRPKVANDYAGVSSQDGYDLRDSEVKVRLLRTLRQTAGTDNYLDAAMDSDNRITMGVDSGLFYIVVTVAAGKTSLTGLGIPYDPAEHLWLRLREKAGTLYCETSGDGETWTVQASLPDPFDLSSMILEIGAGIWDVVASPGVALFDSFNLREQPARTAEERRLGALGTREKAARLGASGPHPEHLNNDDEVSYLTTPFAGNFSKGLKHDSVGDPDPATYAIVLRALESREPNDFEEIVLGGAKKLTNPQSGLAFDVLGPDAQAVTMPPAPRFDSVVAAHEEGELYWMAAARDVAFINYGTDSIITAAVSSLNTELPRFGGTTPVTTKNVFRGIYPGEQVGPYVSQFLLKGNADPRKPDGAGRDADEGYITYGIQFIDQRLQAVKQNVDYLTDFTGWLAVQNGEDRRGQDQFDTQRRFIRSLRDGTNFVHFDQVVNAWWNAAFILLAEPTSNQLTGVGAGRPQVDMEFPFDQGNAYDRPGTAMDSKTQIGFGTFGPLHLLELLIEVSTRAARAVWFQKWFVHRRLRPEEYAGRVDNQIAGRRSYGGAIDASLLTSLQTGLLANYYGPAKKFTTRLLPQAYPEGAPTHPAYGAGHATISGACATIVKAFFDESKAIESPVQAAADGLSLVAYAGTDASQMTVGGEINKLAGNIALFRNAAGVHWRSDYTFSLLLGEEIAIRMLQELSLTYNEDQAFFQLTRFDGTTIIIRKGKVELFVTEE
jgi:hypothetical protein